jgi:hypothetical protein
MSDSKKIVVENPIVDVDGKYILLVLSFWPWSVHVVIQVVFFTPFFFFFPFFFFLLFLFPNASSYCKLTVVNLFTHSCTN